jgi:hypothetical protein
MNNTQPTPNTLDVEEDPQEILKKKIQDVRLRKSILEKDLEDIEYELMKLLEQDKKGV